jgi:hypothetical protein
LTSSGDGRCATNARYNRASFAAAVGRATLRRIIMLRRFKKVRQKGSNDSIAEYCIMAEVRKKFEKKSLKKSSKKKFEKMFEKKFAKKV